MKSFKNHIDPAKEEQLQWQKIEVENQVKRIVKLTKTINRGNKEANLKKKSELINLIQDFNHTYESINSLYEDLKDKVKSQFKPGDIDHSHSSSESELNEESTSNKSSSEGSGSGSDNVNSNKESENFQTVLKDKLTSSSEVKKEIVIANELTVRDQESEVQIVSLKNEIETLGSDKRRLESEAVKMSEKISRLEASVFELEAKESEAREQAALGDQRKELEIELGEKSNEIENLKTELEQCQSSMEKKIMDEKDRFEAKLKDFEKEIVKVRESELLQEELKRKTSQLEKSLSDRENEVSSLRKKLESLGQSSDAKIKNLERMLEKEQNQKHSLQEQLQILENDKAKLEQEKHEFSQTKSRMEQKNTELTDKIADQQKTLIDLGNAMSKLEKENEQAQIISSVSKSDFKFVERKIEETTEEFRKQFEDKYRILSRRIRVAEQLHAENKEWYRASKEAYDQGFKNIRDLSVSSNETLISLDSMVMKLEECNANFLNRVSKASCELKFARDWVLRKNKALSQAKGDLECLIAQLDHKESEILGLRERMWRSDNKVRELEKMVKERDDAMMGLKEEKREAIRQLCVWIDYHRSRSDYYLKVLSENHVVGRSKNKKTN